MPDPAQDRRQTVGMFPCALDAFLKLLDTHALGLEDLHSSDPGLVAVGGCFDANPLEHLEINRRA